MNIKEDKKEFMEVFINEHKDCIGDPSYLATECLIMSNDIYKKK